MSNPVQSASELLEVNSKLSKHSADASSPNEFPSDKSGPPSKRSRYIFSSLYNYLIYSTNSQQIVE